MDNTKEFTSVLAPYFTAFVREHSVKGYKSEALQSQLRRFDHFLFRTGHKDDYVMKSTCDKWLEEISVNHPATVYNAVSVLARFLRYLSELGHESHIPRLPKKPNRDFVPYIYSDDQMKRIFEQADACRMKNRNYNAIMMVIPALLRLLYSTGIRIGEALSIRNRDVDFKRNVILLTRTKNRCQRLAPLNASMEAVLKQYIYYRNQMPLEGLRNPDSPLFVSGVGKSPSKRTVYDNFRKIIKKAGIHYKGGHAGPNLHGIRHSTCVKVMRNMVHEGKDMYCCLPVLSAFMGHKHVVDTEIYIHLTQEMYPELIQKDLSITASISKVIASAIIITENEKK